ncbi:MAG: type III pantothenate kinase [Treponema sp.]|nr:type III pantothenate kinase [Treponema sp.]
MVLIFDIGNTNIKAAIADNDKIIRTKRFKSDPELDESYFLNEIQLFISEEGLSKCDINDAAISSVVPELTGLVERTAASIIEKRPLKIDSCIYKKIPVKVPDSAINEIGSDLLCDAAGAWKKYSKPCIILNFGTALAFTAVTQEAHIAGIAIAPGLETALKSLAGNTALLNEVPLEIPESSLGTDTKKSIQAGIVLGYKGLAESMIKRIKTDMNHEYNIPEDDIITIATGGLFRVIKPITDGIDFYDPEITLYGILKILEAVNS